MSTVLKMVGSLTVVLGLLYTGLAQAQFVAGLRGYNPYTGYGGKAGAAYNPYTGARAQSRTAYNPYTGASASVQRAYNPYTGRYGYRYSYRR